ncbi:PDC sensor domain-containing protein [Helicobacter pylori]|uniref:PDC sensor domain-containing protein n=1 Tax=Helicobacter pylori TaxID=210 RepID=UPI0009587087|nr:PDC sensor domain-containing protein [Helicobacter pylori]BAW38281.1 general glycosylation pathway protein [Helicobacter pylori]BAW51114.1 general glycosylation pathway protein [Helicobacter pylori]
MLSRDIVQYSKIRTELYAYLTYLFSHNIRNHLPEITLDYLNKQIRKMHAEIKMAKSFFVLDAKGMLILKPSQLKEQGYKEGILEHDLTEGIELESHVSFSDKYYFYQAVSEKRCILTDPYPSKKGNHLVVSASYPVYDQNNDLAFVVCLQIPLRVAIEISSPSKYFRTFSEGSMVMYFMISIMLTLVSLLLFVKCISSFWTAIVNFNSFDIKEVFHPIVLLTLALATFDLVKAIFEEEVLGKNSGDNHHAIHRTMIRFLGSIIIALAIEALMLVFKFSVSEPDKITYAVYLAIGVAVLLISLAIYVKFAYSVLPKRER